MAARETSSQAAESTSEDSGETLSIGELARRTGVSTRTIRYYEELGILPIPARTSGGTRRYPREFVFYVEGARQLKELGFGLEEIAELGKFALTGTATNDRSREILMRKLDELDHRIRVLNKLHDLVTDAATSSGKRKRQMPALLRWVGEDSARNGKANT